MERKKSKMNDEKLRKIWDSIVPDLVEEHFPKGKCKERGQAIVLVALIYCEVLPKLCENCKEEKLNTVAKYFKKYNKDLAHYNSRRLSEGEIISILSNPKYWCPSKGTQWKRMAKALLKKAENKNELSK